MTVIEHMRGTPALAVLRGHHPAVIVCLDDPAAFEERRGELEALDAKLIVEREPGPLSQRLGRPSVTVCDRWLEVDLHAEQASPDEVITKVRWLEMRCEECPQARVDMGYRSERGTWA